MGDKKSGRFKKSGVNKGKRISALDLSPDYDSMPILFSLQWSQDHTKYGFSELNQEDKASFSEAIYKRRNISWKELKQMSRHGLGFEKINQNSITAPFPQFLSDDVDHFLAFRYSGKKAMVGYRQKEVFFVLWFDHDFTLYKH